MTIMTSDIQRGINPLEPILHMSAAAGLGYLCARAFAIMDPIHAAVFSASAMVVAKIVSPIFENAFAGWGASDGRKTIGFVLGSATAIAISAGVSTALGFPVTFGAGVMLTSTIYAVVAFGAMGVALASRNNVAL